MELDVDNNLLWRSKAYSFGHFVCDLCGDAAHVQDTNGPFSHQHLLQICAWDINFYYSFPFLSSEAHAGRDQSGIISRKHFFKTSWRVIHLNEMCYFLFQLLFKQAKIGFIRLLV